MSIRRGWIGLLGMVPVMALLGCGGSGSAAGGRTTGSPAGSSAGQPAAAQGSAALPAGFDLVGGDAYRIGVPATPGFAAQPEQLRDAGARVRIWTYDPAPGDNDRGQCFVEAFEQPRYGGNFPQVSILLFAQPEPQGQKIIRNAELRPTPDGTLSAVTQEATMPVKLLSGRRIEAHQWQRQYLLPDRTLISVTVTVPADQTDQCRGADIAASLRPTGRPMSSAASSSSS